MMRQRMTALFLALCLVLSLAACSSGGGGAPSQAQEPSAASSETPQESKEAEDEASTPPDGAPADAAEETNEYGVTDAALQSLFETVEESVTRDYLNAYDINPSDFSWPEAGTTFWNVTCSIISLAVNNGTFASLPEDLFSHLSDEEKALSKALLSGIEAWETEEGGKFFQIASTLPDKDSFAQFFLDNVTFE